jgi:hypothetical protein
MTVKKSPNKAKTPATSTKLKNAAKSLAAQIAVSKPSSAKAATERAAKTGTKPSGGRASKAEPQPMTARAMFASLSQGRQRADDTGHVRHIACAYKWNNDYRVGGNEAQRQPEPGFGCGACGH